MISFGNANDHLLHTKFGVLSYFSPLTSLSVWFRGRLKSTSGNAALLMGCWDWDADGGWRMRARSVDNWKLELAILNNSPASEFLLSNTTLVANTYYTFGVVWHGASSTCDFYLNGIPDGTPATTLAMSQSLKKFAINSAYGDNTESYNGAWDIEHLIVYPNIELGADDFKALHAGMFSRPEDAKFWWTGQYTPGRNEIIHASGGEEIGTNVNGTPTPVEEAGFQWHWPLVGMYRPASSGEASDPGATEEGLMAPSMYAELTGRGRVYFCYELDLPDDTTIRASIKSLPTEEGLYENLLESISDITIGGSVEPSYSLRKLTASVKVKDKGRVIAKRFTGEFENLIEGSACRVRLISPHVPAADWFTCFEGVFERWDGSDMLPYMTHYLGVYDKPLEGGASLGVISADLFPDCASYDDEGSEIPAVYGIHDATLGALTALRISETEFLSSAGFLSELTEVFVDDVLDATWSQQNIERAGRYFTEILFDPAPAADVVVTFNCNGIEKYGDGSGPPITNSAEQLLHMIVNWYYGKYERDSWYSASEIGAPVNTGHFAQVAEFMRQFGWTSKKTITKSTTGYQLCNGWSGSWRIPMYWGFDGKLAVRANRFYVQRGSQPRIDKSDARSILKTPNVTTKLRDEVVFVDPLSNETKVKDVLRGHNVVETISNTWII